MTKDAEAAIIANELDSLIHRIEALPANGHYTSALIQVQKAKQDINSGRVEIHKREMEQQFGAATR